MFEKEAEEIANKKLCSERICYNHCNFNSPKHHRCGEWHRIYDCAKESVEFGYNKAKGELEEDAKAIAKENAELKEKLDKIRKYLVYDIFDRFKYLENLLKISQETQEELSKRILEQQGSLTDKIDEIKSTL